MPRDGETAASLLRELREARGESLRFAANELGMAASHLSRIERGERTPGDDVRSRIAHHYGLPSETLELMEGRVPGDVAMILLRHPQELDRLRSLYGNERVADGG